MFLSMQSEGWGVGLCPGAVRRRVCDRDIRPSLPEGDSLSTEVGKHLHGNIDYPLRLLGPLIYYPRLSSVSRISYASSMSESSMHDDILSILLRASKHDRRVMAVFIPKVISMLLMWCFDAFIQGRPFRLTWSKRLSAFPGFHAPDLSSHWALIQNSSSVWARPAERACQLNRDWGQSPARKSFCLVFMLVLARARLIATWGSTAHSRFLFTFVLENIEFALPFCLLARRAACSLVKSKYNRNKPKVRSKWHRSATEVGSKWNRLGDEMKPEWNWEKPTKKQRGNEVNSKCGRGELEDKFEWNRKDIEL